jgi:fucose permease
MKRNANTLIIVISFAGFIILGMPSGVLGVAWPSVRSSFGLPLDAVGTLLITTTAGYLLSSFTSGRVVSRMGVGAFLTVGTLLASLGLLGYALAPAWLVMVLLGFLAGMGSGVIDAGLNTYFATHFSASLMNWLHACFGVGATVGPAVMTAILNLGFSWRWGYAVAAFLCGLLALAFGLTRSRWRLSGSDAGVEGDPQQKGARSRVTLGLPVVWLGIAAFFVFTGVEVSAGQWPYSLFTEARGIAPATAGLWVSVYWGSLTVGRIVLGPVVDRLGITTTLRACMLGAVLGAALIAWGGTDVLSFAGLAVMGFALAPIFPSLMTATPGRVGFAHAANAIGFQVSAASLGGAILPGVAGVLAANLGLEIIGPYLVLSAILLFLLHEALVWFKP